MRGIWVWINPDQKVLDAEREVSFLRRKASSAGHPKGERMDQRAFPGIGKTAIPREVPEYDVSIILNLHNEARYLKRTMLSLEEAVRYAQQFDITFEIVVVLDNADRATTSLAEAYDYSAFDGFQIIHVRNGSLGLSRNDGIAVSRGNFITTADGDDLLAFDFLEKMYHKARSHNEKVVVFPEYCFGFGSKCYIWKFYSHKAIGNSSFFERHPYVSRIMANKDIYKDKTYLDVSVKSGYAYEDWHFNTEILAKGFSIEVAAGAILFYRQRPGSLLSQADSGTSRLIPKSRFFEPETYLKLTRAEMDAAHQLYRPAKQFTLQEFFALPGISEIVAAANRIDPAISLGILKYSHAGTNLANPGPLPAAYFELCSLVAGNRFTDVILLPFLTKGGAEKYILMVLKAIKKHVPGARFLVLCGQRFEKHDWLDKLPEDCLFVDLHRLGVPGLDQKGIEHITFRLIQHLDGLQRIHVKGSEYGDSILKTYSSKLRQIPIYLYYFCQETSVENGLQFTNGYAFDLISEFGGNFTGLISDHARGLDFLCGVIGEDTAEKAHTLYAECSLPEKTGRAHRRPSRKLLWASRIDWQKRPELPKKIAQLLEKEGLDVGLDAYGGTTYGDIGPEVFDGAPLLSYKGPFDGFHELPAADYDGFLYTAAFDGLPNVVLEAMAAELPVIAPDVGGIAEAVGDETGYLVEDDPDADRLAESFVEAIKALYADWPEAVRRGENGRRLIAERHSREAFLKRVAEVFGLGPAARRRTAGRPTGKVARRAAGRKERA